MNTAVQGNIINPMNAAAIAINKGNLSFSQLGGVLSNLSTITKHNTQLQRLFVQGQMDAFKNVKATGFAVKDLSNIHVGFMARLRVASTALGGFSQNLIKMGKNAQWAGRQVMVGLTVPLGFLAFAASKAFIEVDESIVRTVKVYNFATEEFGRASSLFKNELESLKNRITNLGSEAASSFGNTSAETTKLMAVFSQMGQTGVVLEELTRQTLALSRIGNAEIEESTNLVRVATQAYGVELAELEPTLARLNMLGNRTALSVGQLAGSLPIAANAAATLNLRIEETGALMAVMAESGVDAKEAATALRTGLVRLVRDPGPSLIKSFKALNMNFEEMQERHGPDVIGLLREMSEGLRESGAEGNEVIKAMADLFGIRQVSRMQAIVTGLADMENQSSAAGRAFSTVAMENEEALKTWERELKDWQDSVSGAAQILKAELSTELVKFGERFAVVKNQLMETVVELLKWFNNLEEGTQNWIFKLAGLLAALGPLTMLAGIFANAIGQIMFVFSKLIPSTKILTAEQAVQNAVFGTGNAAITSRIALNEALIASQRGVTASTAELTAAQAAYLAGQGVAAEGAIVPVGGKGGKGGLLGFLKRGGNKAKGLFGRGVQKAGLSGLSAAAMMGLGGGGQTALGLGAAAAAAAAMAAALAAILVVVAAIAVKWKDFTSAFMEQIKPGLETVNKGVSKFQELSNKVMEIWNDPRFQENLSEIASSIGTILGTVFNVLAEIGMHLLDVIVPAVGVVANLFKAIASLISGDLSGAWRAMKDMVVDFVVFLVEGLVKVMKIFSGIPGVGSLLNKALDAAVESVNRWADGLREEVNPELKFTMEAMNAIADAQKTFNQDIEAGEELLAKLVEDHDELKGILTFEKVMAADINDQQRRQLFNLLATRDALERALELDKERARLSLQMAEIEAMQATTASEGIQKSLLRERISRMIFELTEESLDLERRRTREELAYIDAANATEEAIKAQNEALKEQAELQKQIRDDLRSALQKSMGDIMGKIVDSVKDALGQEEEALSEAADAEKERIKGVYEDKIERIEESAQKQIDAIDATIEAEAELDKRREEWFRREKLRIDFLSSQFERNIRLRSHLAKGELDEAAIIREQLFRGEQKFFLDQLQDEEKEGKQARKNELDAKKDAIKEAMELEKERAKEEMELAEEIADAQEKAARDAFLARKDFIERELEEWKRVLPATQGEFNRHIGALKAILAEGGIAFEDITDNYMTKVGKRITSGFTDAIKSAQDALMEEEKWARAGESIVDAFGKGFRERWAEFIKWAESELEISVADEGGGGGAGGIFDFLRLSLVGGGLKGPTEFHTGGAVRGQGGAGLRPDETVSVLQDGEYVIQRDAARKIGRGLLEGLNRMHLGGEVMKSSNSLLNMMGGGLGTAAALIKILGKGPAGVGQFTPGGGGQWPPRRLGKISANTAAAMKFIKENWTLPFGVGTGLARQDKQSDHPWGKALDIMLAPLGKYASGKQVSQGWNIANWFASNADTFGTKYLIWQKMINSGSGWRPYTRYGDNPGPTLGHYDHVHASFLRRGGRVKFDNTLANLHRGETVLTSRLSDKLEQKIAGSNTYTISVNAYGADLDEEKLAKTIMKKLRDEEMRKDRGRVS